MSHQKLKLFTGLIILVVLFVIFYCGLITLQWNKASYNFGVLDTETSGSMRNCSGEAINGDEASTISSEAISQTNVDASLAYLHASVLIEEPPYHRSDNIPEKTKMLPFLKNFKNPCWRESINRNKSSKIRCLPYFHSVGPPKCGTTDLHRRLIRHPQISSNVMKEIQWIASNRFSSPKVARLSKYLRYFDRAVTSDIIPSEENGYYNAIIGDFSPTTLSYTKNYWRCLFQNFTSNADVIHHLYPGSKIIVSLRNPVTRSYSEFKHFVRKPTPELFHSSVVTTIKKFDRHCRNVTHLRRCIDKIRHDSSAFLLTGVYYVYLEEFVRLFPRQQIMITKLEDRSKYMKSALKKIFSFLDTRPLSEEEVADLAKQPVSNQNKKGYYIPEMLNETRLMLEEFYKPFNEKLGDLIGPEYNYNINK